MSTGAGADLIFKYIIIGDMGVGKSCLLHQFQEQKFLPESNHTIGVEFGTKVVHVDGKQVKLQIWDTAGQERFRSVTRSYYRGAACAILVYDITRRSTYQSLQNWLADARKLVYDHTVFVLVGNKIDLKAQRTVTYEEAAKFAEENKLRYIEASAKTGEKVEEVFLETARDILKNIDSGRLDPNLPDAGVQVIKTTAVIPAGRGDKKNCNC